MPKPTYKDAGVDLKTYRESMSRLPALVRRTHTPRVLPAEGGFAGLFQLDFAGKLFARNYRDPVLVSCTDGVGTKLKVAQLAGVHNTVGIDLVAMCVNDAICCGAEPLFFLDYVAMDRDDPDRLEAIVEGISSGCADSNLALVGGETAIMPDLYQTGDYDLAGFCVGVVDRERLIDGSAIAPGDTVLGLASSGLHSNGYSLVRKIVFEIAGLGVNDRVEALDATVGDALLTPTRLYAKPIHTLLERLDAAGEQPVHGIAHITGGGLQENLERILPAGAAATVDLSSWPVPPVFSWLQQLADVDTAEMRRVFNMGVGLALVVRESAVGDVTREVESLGETVWPIGRIAAK